MGREGWRRRTVKRTSKDMAAAQWSFDGSGLLRGGTCRRLMVTDDGGEVRRRKRRWSHGHCGGLQSLICSHPWNRQLWRQGRLRSPASPKAWHARSVNTLQGATRASQSSRTQAHVHMWILQLWSSGAPLKVERRLSSWWPKQVCVHVCEC